jgi:hypothetical protein
VRLIREIQVEGARVTVHADPEFSKRFLREPFFAEYGIEVDQVPDDIAAIPFLTTMLPIAWRFGYDMKLPTADASFVDSMELARERLRAMYPDYEWGGGVEVGSRTQVPRPPDTDKVGILFSGGVDSTFSALRAAEAGEAPVLITIWGNDVKLHDVRGWEDVSSHSTRLAKAIGGEACTVKSNFRSCLRYDVLDASIPAERSWWGFVQHGLAVAGLAAPIVHAKGASRLLVAATHTGAFDAPWGSGPELEGRLRWSSAAVEHDGFEVSRQEKLGAILGWASQRAIPQHLRVCYSKSSDAGTNCTRCEKCVRTITGLLLEGAVPQEWGFDVDPGEASRRTRQGFERRRFRLGDDELFMWQDLQHRAEAEAPDSLDRPFRAWLREFDFAAYREREKSRDLGVAGALRKSGRRGRAALRSVGGKLRTRS